MSKRITCVKCGNDFLDFVYSTCPECGYHGSHKGFQAAWSKGYEAGEAGKASSTCPYPDYRTGYKAGATFSRAWAKYWHAGFKVGAKAYEER